MKPVICSGCHTIIRDRYQHYELRHEIRKVSDLSRYSTRKVADLCRVCAEASGRPMDVEKKNQGSLLP